MIRAFGPGLVEKGWGRIINISSIAGTTGYPYPKLRRVQGGVVQSDPVPPDRFLGYGREGEFHLPRRRGHTHGHPGGPGPGHPQGPHQGDHRPGRDRCTGLLPTHRRCQEQLTEPICSLTAAPPRCSSSSTGPPLSRRRPECSRSPVQRSRMPGAERCLPTSKESVSGCGPFPSLPGKPHALHLGLPGPGQSQCVVIDPGFDSDSGWLHLEAGLQTVGLTPDDVTGIVATHFHVDHLGMAETACQSGGRLDSTRGGRTAPYLELSGRRRGGPGRPAQDGLLGCAGGQNSGSGHDHGQFGRTQRTRRCRRPAGGRGSPAGGRPADPGPGHAWPYPRTFCLWDEGSELVFSGDHVLPRISPNVSLEIRGMDNPLLHNLRSLQKLYGAARL